MIAIESPCNNYVCLFVLYAFISNPSAAGPPPITSTSTSLQIISFSGFYWVSLNFLGLITLEFGKTNSCNCWQGAIYN